jgi:carboxymethylenebutenolidase
VPTATPTPEAGVTVRPDDPSLEAGRVEFPSDGVTLLGYQARPKGPGPFPAVLVIHENRGLLPHFPDVARRLAQAGYVALALDMASREGGTAKFTDPAQVSAALGRAPQARLVEDMNGGVRYLQSLPSVRRDRIGAMGFCFGGGMVWLLSVRNPEVKAAVPFYGSRPPLEEVPNLRAAVLGIYGGEDRFINPGVPELEAALKQHNKSYRLITYPGAGHAFFNDTGRSYHPEAAAAAWRETLRWLDLHLKG